MFSLMRSYYCLALVFGMIPLLAWTQGVSQGGLKFHGSEVSIDQRSSYDVLGDETVGFSDRFSIDFDLALYPTTAFGYILRIKNKESNRIYNLFYDGQGDDCTFKFNEEGKSSLIVATMDRDELLDMHWFNMSISFNLRTDSITLRIHDQTFVAGNEDLPHIYYPIVLFGKSDHIIDVPSFAIKDLSVGNLEKYVFPLNESDGNVVHDSNGEAFGEVENPEWLVNDAYHWRFKAAFRSQSVAGANYSPKKKEIYYFNRDTLHIYNVRSGQTDIKVFEEDCPVRLILGTNFVDTTSNKLYSYETYYSSPHNDYDGPTVASLDLNTYQWTAENGQQLTSPLHHHGGYLNPSRDEYTIFGGFGNMRYSKDFFAYNLHENKWDTLEGFTGDFLSPRYFSSVGYLKENNSVYIFGGMGNESGEQTVGRQYYYDLYRIDLNTKHITKLWEIKWDHHNVVPVRGMVILNDSCFYTLCYPEHFSESKLSLYRFSLADGAYEILGDSIPIQSDKITTNANLYYDSTLNNLFAVVQEFEDDISSDLKVYSLSFPPLTAKQLAAFSPAKRDLTLLFVILASAAVTGIAYVLYKKRKVYDSHPGNDQRRIPIPNNEPETVSRPNAIYLFGDFTVRDRNNKDITYMFSAQLKQIFCLILQYTSTEGGIASQRLSSILWPDKPADKVKNSRGVTINHLRKALGELAGIELIYERGYFRLAQTDGFYCDYTRCIEIISANEANTHKDELVEIISRGKFLQLSDHPLYDSFKEEMEKKLEPVLLVEIEKSFVAEQFLTTIALAKAISNIDPLNEDALTFQVRAMQRLKMHDEARLKYQAYVTEYKKVMGTEYPHPFRS